MLDKSLKIYFLNEILLKERLITYKTVMTNFFLGQSDLG